jgi:hypothetical protein
LLLGSLALAGAVTLPALPDDRPANPPVLLAEASAALVNAFVAKHIDQTEGFTDVILEVPQEGMRRTIADVRAELVPNSSHAALDIIVGGTNYSSAIGKRPLTRIYTHTAIGFEVAARIAFDANGFVAWRGPIGARAHIMLVGTHDIYGDVDSTPANLARIGFGRDREEAESIVSRKTAYQTSLRQQAELTPTLEAGNRVIAETRAQAVQLGLNISSLCFRTMPTYLQGQVAIALPGKSALSPPPAIASDADLRLRIHETLFNEAARGGLGGQTYRLGEVNELGDRLTARMLRDARDEASRAAGRADLDKLLKSFSGKPASVTFARGDPVLFAFIDHGFTVQAHLASIQLGDKLLPSMHIKATYRIENSADGVLAVRKGAIQLVPDAAADQKDKVLIALLRGSVGILAGEVMKERLLLADLPRLTAAHADSGNGWLTATWKLKK